MDDEGMALEGEAGKVGVLKVEGVPSTAVCSLLMLGTRKISPLS